MDYDRFDAFLHHIFKETQGDSWFRPSEENVSTGVCLRVDYGKFRVFPYENLELEPFETAVTVLNPVVAVKLRSAAVHAVLAEVDPQEQSVYVDLDTRIQVLDTMLQLPNAEREQCAAFIRDERVLVVWSDDLNTIIPSCKDLEDRLIKLLWRTRPAPPAYHTNSAPSSIFGGRTGRAGSYYGPSNASSHAGSQSNLREAFTNSAPKAGEIELSPRDSRTSSSHPLGADAEKSRSGLSNEIKDVDNETEGNEDDVDREIEGDGDGDDYAIVQKRRGLFGFGNKQAVGKPRKRGGKRARRNRGANYRPVVLYAPVYNGLAAALSIFFIGNGVAILIREWVLDQNFMRFILVVAIPFLFCVSLFFTINIFVDASYCIGPIAQYHRNSKYYSALRPLPSKKVDNHLPHVTIQMPVYKESLNSVLAPSFEYIKRAMQTYARQGGTSNLFVNDDGLQLLPPGDRDERIAYYETHGIGWVARPPHTEDKKSKKMKGEKGNVQPGFKRAGRFKKASNMNYALNLSLRLERHLEALKEEREQRKLAGADNAITESEEDSRRLSVSVNNSSLNGVNNGSSSGSRPGTGNGITPRVAFGGTNMESPLTGGALTSQEEALEEKALLMAIEEIVSEAPVDPNVPSQTQALDADADLESGEVVDPKAGWRPWAANGKACRVGEIVLLVDSDTVVPEDCFRDAAREFKACPTVAILQHESDVMQVAHHYFENGIAYFTRRVNKSISMSCANGEVAPFVGHNAFLRWKAVQDAAFIDPNDGVEKIWSENNVSEDFDMALRLQMRGFIIRWATYSRGGFKEGVSLTPDDELNRWQKYAYGCSELLFNPFAQWWRKGPINKQIHQFLWSKAPLHYKISMLSYMFSYYGIAASLTISLINYVILGFELRVDGYYLHSFEIWLATTVIFLGAGNIGYTLLEYRLGERELISGLIENLTWLPFFFFFFGGMSIHLTQAMLAHLFSYNMTWAATKKEVERSNFFKEVPRILKRFWFALLVSIISIVAMIILATPLVPITWRIGGSDWAVIFPLAVQTGCHILYPIILNPWLMIFSY